MNLVCGADERLELSLWSYEEHMHGNRRKAIRILRVLDRWMFKVEKMRRRA